ncbi:MAG: type IV pilin protein [Actinomycetota bacterium]
MIRNSTGPYAYKPSSAEAGFTVLELMVVVLIIAILIATAVPTFLAARQRTNDRAAEIALRNVLASEKIYYTGALAYADNSSGGMTSIDASIQYVNSMTPGGVGTVSIGVSAGPTCTGCVYLGSKSQGGACYYLVDDPFGGTGYSTDPSCGAADGLTYHTGGW